MQESVMGCWLRSSHGWKADCFMQSI